MGVDRSKTKFAAKWPEEVAKHGFAAVPKCLITCMAELGLKPQEAVILFNIIEKCWEAGDKARQGVDYLATAIGRKNSATREITKSLTEKGFITKQQRYNKTNLYGLEPTAQKLAEHMPLCKHIARNPTPYSRKTGGQDGQKSSDYIEAEILRNNYLDINSRDYIKNVASDPLEGEIIEKGKGIGICHINKGRHVWEDFELEKSDVNGEPVAYYYRNCVNCGLQFHKKGEPPWPGYYPPRPSIVTII